MCRTKGKDPCNIGWFDRRWDWPGGGGRAAGKVEFATKGKDPSNVGLLDLKREWRGGERSGECATKGKDRHDGRGVGVRAKESENLKIFATLVCFRTSGGNLYILIYMDMLINIMKSTMEEGKDYRLLIILLIELKIHDSHLCL